MTKAASNGRATSAGLLISAAKLRADAKNPKTRDDPGWLARGSEKMRSRAYAKEKALEHKKLRASKGKASNATK